MDARMIDICIYVLAIQLPNISRLNIWYGVYAIHTYHLVYHYYI